MRRKAIKGILISASCIALLLLYLAWEQRGLAQSLHRIRLRICVTGTRGKSTVTRLIASSLREAGFSVLAKTTGSKPVVIFPDGTEKEIKRKGKPTILEHKRILKIGAHLGVDALVAEFMGIRPECLSAESKKILCPQFLAITNVRLDHRDEMGGIEPEIAESLSKAIPQRCTVFLPEEEFYPVFQKAVEKSDSTLIRVPKMLDGKSGGAEDKNGSLEFAENIHLALAVARFLGVNEDIALQGLARARPDFGSLRIWKISASRPSSTWFVISAFAANDPESTRKVLSRLKERIPFEGKKLVGLLNFRRDRGDRTLQWLESLEAGSFQEFQRLVFIGDYARLLSRRCQRGWSSDLEVSAVFDRNPKTVMDKLFATVKGDAVLVGMGNMAGLGKELVEYWARIGDASGA